MPRPLPLPAFNTPTRPPRAGDLVEIVHQLGARVGGAFAVEVERAEEAHGEAVALGFDTSGEASGVVEAQAVLLRRVGAGAQRQLERGDLALARIPQQRPAHRRVLAEGIPHLPQHRDGRQRPRGAARGHRRAGEAQPAEDLELLAPQRERHVAKVVAPQNLGELSPSVRLIRSEQRGLLIRRCLELFCRVDEHLPQLHLVVRR
mmetsp:Transcript_29397/g.51476  ORF Transcript_29397/g.51476 Transcript_29397/m.51476 type:complete len:204 (-) Transcript_29397:150-761(-)